jgi:hypothetical protein
LLLALIPYDLPVWLSCWRCPEASGRAFAKQLRFRCVAHAASTGRSGRRIADLEERAVFGVMGHLAARSRALAADAKRYERALAELIRSLDDSLLDEPGIGPISAAKLLACDPRPSRRKVHAGALPERTEDLGDRRVQALVGVVDDQLHPDRAAGDQEAQDLGPERLALRLPDVDAEDLAAAGLMHALGDHDRLARDPAGVPDLLDLRVNHRYG